MPWTSLRDVGRIPAVSSVSIALFLSKEARECKRKSSGAGVLCEVLLRSRDLRHLDGKVLQMEAREIGGGRNAGGELEGQVHLVRAIPKQCNSALHLSGPVLLKRPPWGPGAPRGPFQKDN